MTGEFRTSLFTFYGYYKRFHWWMRCDQNGGPEQDQYGVTHLHVSSGKSFSFPYFFGISLFRCVNMFCNVAWLIFMVYILSLNACFKLVLPPVA